MTDTRSAAARVRAFLEERERHVAYSNGHLYTYGGETLLASDLEELSREEPTLDIEIAERALDRVINEVQENLDCPREEEAAQILFEMEGRGFYMHADSRHTLGPDARLVRDSDADKHELLSDIMTEAHIAGIEDDRLIDQILADLAERGWELRRVPR